MAQNVSKKKKFFTVKKYKNSNLALAKHKQDHSFTDINCIFKYKFVDIDTRVIIRFEQSLVSNTISKYLKQLSNNDRNSFDPSKLPEISQYYENGALKEEYRTKCSAQNGNLIHKTFMSC